MVPHFIVKLAFMPTCKTKTYCATIKSGKWKLRGDKLKVVLANFSTLS
jgi:hypothetical protein